LPAAFYFARRAADAKTWKDALEAKIENPRDLKEPAPTRFAFFGNPSGDAFRSGERLFLLARGVSEKKTYSQDPRCHSSSLHRINRSE